MKIINFFGQLDPPKTLFSQTQTSFGPLQNMSTDPRLFIKQNIKSKPDRRYDIIHEHKIQ